jgi:hypothetical protein
MREMTTQEVELVNGGKSAIGDAVDGAMATLQRIIDFCR